MLLRTLRSNNLYRLLQLKGRTTSGELLFFSGAKLLFKPVFHLPFLPNQSPYILNYFAYFFLNLTELFLYFWCLAFFLSLYIFVLLSVFLCIRFLFVNCLDPVQFILILVIFNSKDFLFCYRGEWLVLEEETGGRDRFFSFYYLLFMNILLKFVFVDPWACKV